MTGRDHSVTVAAMNSQIPIILLAAGQSSRMRGADKLLQDIDGQPQLRRITKAARAATDATVVVALPSMPHDRWATIKDIDVLGLAVTDASEGMNASLRCAIKALPGKPKAVMVLLADLPDLTEKDIATVLQSVDHHKKHLIWRATSQTGIPGHPVVFCGTLIPQLRALTGDNGAQSVVKAHLNSTKFVALPDTHATLDLDTPEDWANWRANR